MEYQECGIPCQDTCSIHETSQICEDHCMDGCFCPEGAVLDDINFLGCILLEECFCTSNNNTYKPGTTISLPCSTCNCSYGHWKCQDIPCSGTCSIEGGSRITSYDGTSYSLYGECTYVFSKFVDDNKFTVLAEIRRYGMEVVETCLKSISIRINGSDTMVHIKDDGSVFINGIYSQCPISMANIIVEQPTSFYIIVSTNHDFMIVIQLVPIMQAYIIADPSLQKKTQGLCGNFNDVQADDFKIISGTVEGTAAAFANTWKTQADCPNAKTIFEDPCTLSEEKEKYAQRWCSVLTDTKGPFEKCHSVVDPHSYYTTCLHQTCSCEKSEDCLCAVFSTYVRACTIRRVSLSGWRANVCNKYTHSCAESQSYSYSISSCQPTCRYISEPDVTRDIKFIPIDGCTCKEGFYMDDSGKCVTRDACPCYHKGSAVLSGEIIHEHGIVCKCIKGKLDCIGGDTIPVCNPPMHYFNCTNAAQGTTGSECQKSCQTLDMECYHTQCISGCVCPQGLVSDGKGDCIPESKCPCIHNDASYQNGDKIKINCNTCICMNRKWQCTEKECMATCIIYGEGHYITFDGRPYNFNGNCEYTLVQDHCGMNNSKSTFQVITENVPCSTTGTTCSKAIKVILGRSMLKFTEKRFEVLEYSAGENVTYNISHKGIYLQAEVDNRLFLTWDRKTSMVIKLGPDFKGQICGLCGTYDGNTANDFTTRSQSVVEDVTEFGNSWKASPTCPDAEFTRDPCTVNPYRKPWAQKKCNLITSKVFASCHSQVDPMKYYDACVTDACACDTGGDCECFCTAVASYARACNEVGVCVVWRTPEICPLFCDYYNPTGECEWHYKPCGSPCMKTCRNPDGRCSQDLPGLEGCYPSCPEDKPYFDEEEMTCVAHCGCYDDEGNYYKQGEMMFPKNCSICNCTQEGEKCIYDPTACYCEYNGKIYKYQDLINHTKSEDGRCMNITCGIDGLVLMIFYACTSPSVAATGPCSVFNIYYFWRKNYGRIYYSINFRCYHCSLFLPN